MRYAQVILIAVVLFLGLLFPHGRTAFAEFHCMRIHAVMASHSYVDGMQYVELRMNDAGQGAVTGHQLKFYDAAGTLKATFTFGGTTEASGYGGGGGPNSDVGDSILIGTAEFNDATTGGDADFTFSGANTVGSNGGDPLHPVQAPGGIVTFAEGNDNCDADVIAGAGEVDTLGYGGASTPFGSAAVALPDPSRFQVLRLGNLNAAPSDNSTEYSLEAGSGTTYNVAAADVATDLTTPRNNDRVVLGLQPVGGVAELAKVAGASIGADRESGVSASLVAGIAAAVAVGFAVASGAAWYARQRMRL